MTTFNKIFGPILTKFPTNNRVERIWKLAQVDFAKRYYNDRLGLIWALLNPLFQIGIYYFIFKIVYQSQIENFAIFIFLGLLIWMSFSEATNRSLVIIKTKKYLIENIQFEKKDLYISSVISVFLGLAFNFFIYILCSLLLGIKFGIQASWFLVILIQTFMLCVGTSMILSTTTGFFKDIKHLWNLALLAGFFGSGIFFEGAKILTPFPFMMYLNPFLGIIENARSCLIFQTTPDLYMLMINFLQAFFILIVGIVSFNKFSHVLLEKSL